MASMKHAFPFAAIVGQDDMKQALLLVSVDRNIGGVMVFGDRGTGKSTAVRSLAALLPPMRVVNGCHFNCDPAAPAEACSVPCIARANAEARETAVPVVDLPLGATEDRVVGALDLERALTRGEKGFEPGLLARAHRGFLYIDEVNLLEDHLVDLLLDVAVSGENIVEREGLSVRHPARFVLIGSGNPEEGELRPQLLDRFGLSVEVRTPQIIEDRVEILRRCDAFERDPQTFAATWKAANQEVSDLISAARARLPSVIVKDDALAMMSSLCMATGADGLRGELTLLRASRAAAALAGDSAVEAEHIRKVAPMALQHRLRRNPLDESGAGVRVQRAVDEVFAA
jgi:magnesium chelatase subunit I